eukprot:TRINITY_DN15256_c0_g1_i1.p1 TRINITY_DN15256_c0_g1~~TRINITY_DN15256_c0_g1_i1.p1  ORF type:complete len:297 (-),score=37.90 TRINITY_DN15256_c0_g1_i1:139-1029(-)
MSRDPIKQGYVHKRGIVGGWFLRWMALSSETIKLFRNQMAERPKYVILLKKLRLAQEIDATRFLIADNMGRYELKAETEQEKEDWLRVIRFAQHAIITSRSTLNFNSRSTIHQTSNDNNNSPLPQSPNQLPPHYHTTTATSYNRNVNINTSPQLPHSDNVLTTRWNPQSSQVQNASNTTTLTSSANFPEKTDLTGQLDLRLTRIQVERMSRGNVARLAQEVHGPPLPRWVQGMGRLGRDPNIDSYCERYKKRYPAQWLFPAIECLFSSRDVPEVAPTNYQSPPSSLRSSLRSLFRW